MRWYCKAEVRIPPRSPDTIESATHVLYELAHARLRDAAAAEELHRVLGGLLPALRAVRLEERDLPSQLRRLLLVRLSADT